MAAGRAKPKSIDEYVAGFSPEIQAILQRIRATIHKVAPEAQETISYQIPAFTLRHIGVLRSLQESYRLLPTDIG